MNHSQNMLAISAPKTAKKILGRRRLRITTMFVTGLGTFKARLKLFKIITNDMCRFCKEHSETAQHILCECPMFQYLCITSYDLITDPSQWKIYKIEKL